MGAGAGCRRGSEWPGPDILCKAFFPRRPSAAARPARPPALPPVSLRAGGRPEQGGHPGSSGSPPPPSARREGKVGRAHSENRTAGGRCGRGGHLVLGADSGPRGAGTGLRFAESGPPVHGNTRPGCSDRLGLLALHFTVGNTPAKGTLNSSPRRCGLVGLPQSPPCPQGRVSGGFCSSLRSPWCPEAPTRVVWC